MKTEFSAPYVQSAQEKDHEIIHNGFSPLVKTPGLFLCIVIERLNCGADYAVYMRHGSPGGPFWKNGCPVRRCRTMQEANELIDQLAGLVNAHKQFPIYER